MKNNTKVKEYKLQINQIVRYKDIQIYTMKSKENV